MSVSVTLDIPDGAFSALRLDSEGMAKELRLAAAAKWYELGALSQEKAAEVAGLPRAEFVAVLARFSVNPVQYSTEELKKELGSA